MSYDSKDDDFHGSESSTSRGVEGHRRNNNDKKERENTVRDKGWQKKCNTEAKATQ